MSASFSASPSATDHWALKVVVSVIVYCLAASAVPIYNKEVFKGPSGHVGVEKYPYPIATAFVQLAAVCVALSLVSVLGHFTKCGRSRDSWLFGPHFFYKVQHVAPVGLIFGLKYGITNWGLQLMPTGTHVLLQSTDLIWTVLLARVINKEKLGCLEYFAAGLSTLGSVMLGLHAGNTLEAPALALAVNFMTPLVLATCITTLRAGAKELFDPNNILNGSMTPVEFTAVKTFLSASVALLLACALENGHSLTSRGKDTAWWTALAEQPPEGIVFLLLGGAFVLIFQVNITWLSGLTSAVTVGIVGGLKVVPQWLLNAMFNLKVDLAPLNLAGAALVLIASMLYALSISLPNELTLEGGRFQWVPKKCPPEGSQDSLGSLKSLSPWLLKQDAVAAESGTPGPPRLTATGVLDVAMGVARICRQPGAAPDAGGHDGP